MKIIFYLPVNIDKPKFVAFLVFLCTTIYIAQIPSSENVLKRDAILAPVAKQGLAKDIPSYGSQSNSARKLLFTDLVNTNTVFVTFDQPESILNFELLSTLSFPRFHDRVKEA